MTTPRGNHAKIARAAAAQSTPEAQFQRMYQENRDLIYHYVLNWVGNHEDAEDLTADIFLRAVGRVDYERPTTTIRRWLFQVARTALADHWRERSRLITCSLEELLASDEGEALEEEAGESYATRAHRLQQLLRTRLSISPPPEEYLDEDGEERTEDNSACRALAPGVARALSRRVNLPFPAQSLDSRDRAPHGIDRGQCEGHAVPRPQTCR